MSIIPPGETIIQTKKCLLSGQEFFITDKDLEFYDKISPVFGGKKYSIPSPTLCPEERQRRRLAFRNERFLYGATCEKTQKPIISIYRPESGYRVVSREEYKKIDNTQSGQRFDDSQAFFPQFRTLYKKTYKAYLHQNGEMENSDYNEYVGYLKNCYLIFDPGKCEKCYFGRSGGYVRNSLDFLDLNDSDNVYEVINVSKSSNIFFSQNCHNSSFLFGCRDCVGCHECIGCINLRNQRHCIFGKKVTEQEFKKAWKDILSGQKNILTPVLQRCSDIHARGVYKNSITTNSNNATGDYVINANNVLDSYQVFEAENIRYCDIVVSAGRDLMDISSFGEQMSYCLEMQASGGMRGKIGIQSCGFSSYIFYGGMDVWYSIDCSENPANVFGCCDLRKPQNCILNTPYSVQEYESLCGKIIDHMRSTGEWGEFFPHELSPFGYNETVAQEYFPLSEQEVKSRGWNWHIEEVKKFEGTPYVPLPVREYTETTVGFETAKKNIDAILAGIICCVVTGKPFKIIRQELAFYIENSLPIPTKHPDQRHKERMDLRNPRKLYERYCMCEDCEKIARETNTFREEEFVLPSPSGRRTEDEGVSASPHPKGIGRRRRIVTTYAPDRKEKVVCEECYRKLVY